MHLGFLAAYIYIQLQNKLKPTQLAGPLFLFPHVYIEWLHCSPPCLPGWKS